MEYEGAGALYEGSGAEYDGSGAEYEGAGAEYEGAGVEYEGAGAEYEGAGAGAGALYEEESPKGAFAAAKNEGKPELPSNGFLFTFNFLMFNYMTSISLIRKPLQWRLG